MPVNLSESGHQAGGYWWCGAQMSRSGLYHRRPCAITVAGAVRLLSSVCPAGLTRTMADFPGVRTGVRMPTCRPSWPSSDKTSRCGEPGVPSQGKISLLRTDDRFSFSCLQCCFLLLTMMLLWCLATFVAQGFSMFSRSSACYLLSPPPSFSSYSGILLFHSRARPDAARLFEKSASQSYHGVVSRGSSSRQVAAAATAGGAGGPTAGRTVRVTPSQDAWSPTQGSHEVRDGA